MSRLLAPLAILPLVACSTGGALSGTVVDGITKAPKADLRVLARSEDTTDLTCKVKEGKTDASGAFLIEGLCSGATYTVGLGDETLMLSQALTVDSTATAEDTKTLTAWRAPSGSGVYRLADDALAPLRTFSDVASETVLDSDVKVRYPKLKPTKAASIKTGQFLVLSGKGVIDRLKVHPLVEDSGKRQFAENITIEDHVYIGVKFTSDTEWEAQTAALDEAKVLTVENGDRMVKYIPADALPDGRYAILGDDDKQTYVFDFGAAPTANAAAE